MSRLAISVQVYLLGSACRDESCTPSWRGIEHPEAGLELHCGPKGTASYLCAVVPGVSRERGAWTALTAPCFSDAACELGLVHVAPFSCVLSWTPFSRFNHPAGKFGMG